VKLYHLTSREATYFPYRKIYLVFETAIESYLLFLRYIIIYLFDILSARAITLYTVSPNNEKPRPTSVGCGSFLLL